MLTIQIRLFKAQNVFLITILQLISKAGIYNVLKVFQRLIEGQKACGNCLFQLIQFAQNFVRVCPIPPSTYVDQLQKVYTYIYSVKIMVIFKYMDMIVYCVTLQCKFVSS